MNLKYVTAFVLFIVLYPLLTSAQSSNRLWYGQPADYFEESLVLGNGKNGCINFGGVSTEKVFLNDASLWSGKPINPYNNPDAYKYVEVVRKALKDENYRLADSLNHKIQGSFTQSYAPLGTMYIHFKGHKDYVNYYREWILVKPFPK